MPLLSLTQKFVSIHKSITKRTLKRRLYILNGKAFIRFFLLFFFELMSYFQLVRGFAEFFFKT